MCELFPANRWANADVFFRKSDGSQMHRIEVLNLNTNERYAHEDLRGVAFKCLGLFLVVNPLYYLFYSSFQLVRVVTVPIANSSLTAFFKEVWHTVKLPFFFIGMQFAAFYGIFQPLDGRALFAQIESQLHDGKGRRAAEQYQKKSSSENVMDVFVEENPKKAFFVAFCMQPLGRTDDPHINGVRRLL